MKIFSIRLFLFISIFLCACTNHPQHNWQIKTGERSSLAFSGKGAAAGVMMDAYLGGAGIAIGIAIDEGIAKTIAENIQKKSPDFSVVALMENQLLKSSSHTHSPVCVGAPLQVVVDTYGFHTFAGEGDKVSAWLKIHFICNGNDKLIQYPSDFSTPKLAELSEVKTNPELAVSLLNDAAVDVISRCAQTFNSTVK